MVISYVLLNNLIFAPSAPTFVFLINVKLLVHGFPTLDDRSEFTIINKSLNWADSLAYCEDLGGRLPCLRRIPQIQEILVMLESVNRDSVYVKGIEIPGFGGVADQCGTDVASSLKIRGFSTVVDNTLKYPFLCTLPFTKQMPVFQAESIVLSDDRVGLDMATCTLLCPRSEYDVRRAENLVKRTGQPAWLGVARIYANGSYLCYTGELVDYLPTYLTPLDFDLSAVKLGVLQSEESWVYKLDTTAMSALCEESTELKVDITPPRSLDYGNLTNVTCAGSGAHISIKLQQMSINKDIAIGTHHVSYQIEGQQENLGDYNCVMKSVLSKDHPVITSTTTLSSPPVFYHDNVTYFVEGIREDIMLLNCSYYGYPRGVFTAYQGEDDIALVEGVTEISRNQSIYTCMVKQANITAVRYTQITDGSWTQTLGDVEINSTPITMSCGMNSVKVFRFFIDGISAEEVSGVEVGLDYIHIPNPGTEHVGVVVCQLPGTEKKSQGSISAPPQPELPDTINGTVNKEIVLECNVRAHPEPAVSWLVDNVEVGRGNPFIFIPDYTHNETDVVCRAENVLGSAQARSKLRLKDLEITQKVDYIEVDEQEDLELMCAAVGMLPITYEWRSYKKRLSDNNIAILRNVTRDSPEHVTCAACSPLSCIQHTVQIFVRGSPRTLSPPFVGQLNRTHLLIDWEQRDNVTYNFYFLVGDAPPQVATGLTSNETVIKRRKGLTEVRLGVSATNKYGSSAVAYTWPPFNLFIPAPGNLHAVEIWDTFADIAWDRTNCEHYLVTVANKTTNFTVTTTETTLRVTHLTGWSKYSIVVIPREGGSIGPSSNTIIVQTLATKLRNPVENISAELLRMSEVFMKWKTPNMMESDGLLEGFEIISELLSDDEKSNNSGPDLHTQSKRQALQSVRLSYAARSFLKRDTIPKRKYRFTIIAIATAGPGPPANVAVDTNYNKYVVPDNIHVNLLAPGAIHVTWTWLPGLNYSIKYWQPSHGGDALNVTVRESGDVVVRYDDVTTTRYVQVGKVYKGLVYNYSAPILAQLSRYDNGLENLKIQYQSEHSVRLQWALETGCDLTTAQLTVSPAIEELLDEADRVNYDNIKVPIRSRQGSMLINTSKIMALYHAQISGRYCGLSSTADKYWYMKGEARFYDNLWVRYLLLLLCCAVTMTTLWVCILTRARVIKNRMSAEGMSRRRQLTWSTRADESAAGSSAK